MQLLNFVLVFFVPLSLCCQDDYVILSKKKHSIGLISSNLESDSVISFNRIYDFLEPAKKVHIEAKAISFPCYNISTDFYSDCVDSKTEFYPRFIHYLRNYKKRLFISCHIDFISCDSINCSIQLLSAYKRTVPQDIIITENRINIRKVCRQNNFNFQKTNIMLSNITVYSNRNSFFVQGQVLIRYFGNTPPPKTKYEAMRR